MRWWGGHLWLQTHQGWTMEPGGKLLMSWIERVSLCFPPGLRLPPPRAQAVGRRERPVWGQGSTLRLFSGGEFTHVAMGRISPGHKRAQPDPWTPGKSVIIQGSCMWQLVTKVSVERFSAMVKEARLRRYIQHQSRGHHHNFHIIKISIIILTLTWHRWGEVQRCKWKRCQSRRRPCSSPRRSAHSWQPCSAFKYSNYRDELHMIWYDKY